jgi:DNA-binding GntR family transcriptional regulator
MPHSTLAENVAAALRESIYNGGHIIGERLIELTLAHEMNVSQNTVRDALRILEQEGLVVKRARRGVHVRAYTAEEAAEVYTLWATLEELALNWAIAGLTENDLDELRDLIEEAHSQTEARNPLGAIESLLTFHETIGRVARKPQTAALLNSILNQVRLLENGVRQVHAPRTFQQRRAQIADYNALLKAVEARDLETARKTLLKTISMDCNALLETL